MRGDNVRAISPRDVEPSFHFDGSKDFGVVIVTADPDGERWQVSVRIGDTVFAAERLPLHAWLRGRRRLKRANTAWAIGSWSIRDTTATVEITIPGRSTPIVVAYPAIGRRATPDDTLGE